MSNLLAIDPGKQGAAVLLGSSGECVRWWPAPLAGKEYDGRLMAEIVQEAGTFNGRGCKAVIELQSAQPPTGRKTAYAIGMGYGRWLQALESWGMPYRIIAPSTWTRPYKPSTKISKVERKRHYVRLARNLYPQAVAWDSIPKYQRSGIADALLLADYARGRES